MHGLDLRSPPFAQDLDLSCMHNHRRLIASRNGSNPEGNQTLRNPLVPVTSACVLPTSFQCLTLGVCMSVLLLVSTRAG